MNNANNRIKTAFEIAIEKAQGIKISEEELEKEKYINEGNPHFTRGQKEG
ncbi:MAG: hypothetical protein U9R03_01310 [Candidatus Aerophobetes bacterium]|nr:hypothetical protein [Candidatus Aerophobetes bacterium]